MILSFHLVNYLNEGHPYLSSEADRRSCYVTKISVFSMSVNQLGRTKVGIGMYQNGMKYRCYTKHARRGAHSHI